MISDKQLSLIFKDFMHSLQDRYSNRVYTTEDSIRYTFFDSLARIGEIKPSQIVLEHPHPKISKAMVDTYIPSENYVFEFKYDRAIPSGKNLPRPMKAGKVFADLFRLSSFVIGENLHRIFVYVSDGEMVSYYKNKNNQLDDFFDLPPKNELVIDENYVSKHCKTFVRSTGTNVTPYKIMSRLRTNLKNQVWIRIYEVFIPEQAKNYL